MQHTATRRKSEPKHFVLFGFNKDDVDQVGYFTAECGVARERKHAKVFTVFRKSKKHGTPEQWCKFVNDDKTLNNGYEFHVVIVKK
ncbi:MAG: hypothetical protein MJ193_02175 [Clostridia bacterium]|nr:hypothetical protein [Clostridia bacterium]